eukprot:CAMPEP_0174301750 /NCGR_PEP_ID=MMETSP0809-20121228/59228_1 /TAXON_ID=73025 ORGANISM="Eutreptiella gymnastica-like, Strain CCMP1594" /NCGR_SAMPLE_ID=MMETSP0809 /ASSEMBLY_ACC=CAM_ASM_000658 /LENGTH=42 /DNA_ID= /DNA_START= /DNA_END= /DNA_ORIENTATION=
MSDAANQQYTRPRAALDGQMLRGQAGMHRDGPRTATSPHRRV